MTRQPRFRPEQLTGDRRALYDAITAGPRSQEPQLFRLTDDAGVLRGPFNALLLSPRLGDALQRLGAAVRYGTALTPRVREMAILVVASHWRSAFEQEAHEAIGRSVGLTDAELRAIAGHEEPPLADPFEAACITLTREMVGGDISPQTWDACVPPVDVETVFELSTLVGYYAMLALQMRVFGV